MSTRLFPIVVAFGSGLEANGVMGGLRERPRQVLVSVLSVALSLLFVVADFDATDASAV
jgi:hypothetical protein